MTQPGERTGRERAPILGGLALLVALGGTPPPDVPDSPPRPPVLKEWPDDGARRVVFSADGKLLVIGRAGGVTIRDATTGKVRAAIEVAERGWAGTSFALSPDGATLATGGEKSVTLWDVATRRERAAFRQEGPDPPKFHNPVTCVAFSPDGSLMAAGDWAARVVLWEVATGAKLATLVGAEGRIEDVSDRGHAKRLAFSPDGQTLAVASDASSIIRPPRTLADLTYVIELWDVPGRSLRHSTARLPSTVTALAFSPDGRLLASTSQRGPVILWDATTGHERSSIRELPAFVNSVAFSPDSRFLVLGGGYVVPDFIDEQVRAGKIAINDPKHWSGEVRVWVVASVQPHATWRVHRQAVDSVACLPDGQTVVTASGETRLWDAAQLLAPKSP